MWGLVLFLIKVTLFKTKRIFDHRGGDFLTIKIKTLFNKIKIDYFWWSVVVLKDKDDFSTLLVTFLNQTHFSIIVTSIFVVGFLCSWQDFSITYERTLYKITLFSSKIKTTILRSHLYFSIIVVALFINFTRALFSQENLNPNPFLYIKKIHNHFYSLYIKLSNKNQENTPTFTL